MVLAEVGTILNSNPLVVLTTQFRDGSQIETGFPFGSNINNEDYRAHTVRASLNEAYHHHLEQIRDWQVNHEAPENINDIGGMLQMDKLRQSVFGKRKLKVLFWQRQAPIIALGVTLPLGWYGARWATLAGAPVIVPYLILIGVPLGPILWIYWKLRSQQQASGKLG